MHEDVISKLRRAGQLTHMANGREGVPITLQFKGKVPQLQRSERKRWLEDLFKDWTSKHDHLPVEIDAQSVSLSGQTIDAKCSIDHIDDIRQASEIDGLQLEVARVIQAAND